jgi:glycosyltransferase involved in cell wall biosynthesis
VKSNTNLSEINSLEQSIMHCPTLEDFPIAPEDKTGWPWTEGSEPLPERMPDGSEWPKISVVTPSYNQGQFIEETIRSVLLQGYPNLEYLIIDGGSTDNTVEIIKKYQPWLTYWVSEKDQGQSHALNKGFQKVTGELVGWQNSDDFYHPDVFSTAAYALHASQDIAVFHGVIHQVNANATILKTFNDGQETLKPIDFLPWPVVNNQSSFFNLNLLGSQLSVDESLHYTMDYELFLRLVMEGYQFRFIPRLQAYGRLHSEAKGSTQSDRFLSEFFQRYKSMYVKFIDEEETREKAWQCLYQNTINSFVNHRFTEFRQSFHELVSISGLRPIKSKLLVIYFLSFLGKSNIIRLRAVSEHFSSLALFRKYLARRSLNP